MAGGLAGLGSRQPGPAGAGRAAEALYESHCNVLYTFFQGHSLRYDQKDALMREESMVILTAKSAETILETGGTQSWLLSRARAKQCRYAVLCQNAHSDWGDGKEPHGKAFMVGRVDDVIPSTDTKERWLVTFSEYAVIDMPGTWGGWRNPVRYATLEEIGIDPGELEFKPMPPGAESPVPPTPPTPTQDRRKGMTIAQAKEGLARTFGVPPEAIEITIRG